MIFPRLVSATFLLSLLCAPAKMVDADDAIQFIGSTASRYDVSKFATSTTPTASEAYPTSFDDLYLDKICTNQPSCHLARNVSGPLKTTLLTRNCMCDSDCNLYGDCCFDSQVYNPDDQRNNHKQFHCSEEKRYLMARCAENYTNDEVAFKCAEGAKSVAERPLRLITPVSDVDRRVTYANLYCAICNNRSLRNVRLRSWTMTFTCEEEAIEAIGANEANETTRVTANTDDGAEMAARNASWRDDLGEYRGYYGHRSYSCKPVRTPPADDEVSRSLRYCVPTISSCPANGSAQLAAKCQAFTLIVFDKNLKPYRNVFCAECNGNTGHLEGCVSPSHRISPSQHLFSSTNKATGTTACNDPNANPELLRRFCT